MFIKTTISTHVIKTLKINRMNSTLYTKPVDAFQNRNHKQSINTSVKKGRQLKKGHQNPFKTVS